MTKSSVPYSHLWMSLEVVLVCGHVYSKYICMYIQGIIFTLASNIVRKANTALRKNSSNEDGEIILRRNGQNNCAT